MSSPQIPQRIVGDIGACDVMENSSPKVEQLVITPFDEGKLHIKLPSSVDLLFLRCFYYKMIAVYMVLICH